MRLAKSPNLPKLLLMMSERVCPAVVGGRTISANPASTLKPLAAYPYSERPPAISSGLCSIVPASLWLDSSSVTITADDGPSETDPNMLHMLPLSQCAQGKEIVCAFDDFASTPSPACVHNKGVTPTEPRNLRQDFVAFRLVDHVVPQATHANTLGNPPSSISIRATTSLERASRRQSTVFVGPRTV